MNDAAGRKMVTDGRRYEGKGSRIGLIVLLDSSVWPITIKKKQTLRHKDIEVSC